MLFFLLFRAQSFISCTLRASTEANENFGCVRNEGFYCSIAFPCFCTIFVPLSGFSGISKIACAEYEGYYSSLRAMSILNLTCSHQLEVYLVAYSIPRFLFLFNNMIISGYQCKYTCNCQLTLCYYFHSACGSVSVLSEGRITQNKAFPHSLP